MEHKLLQALALLICVCSLFVTGDAATSLGSKFMMGVNLGGWLIREHWMFPDEMLDVGINDEWTLIKKKGGPTSAEAIDFMHAHWKNFVTPQDLDLLHDFGITHVRIPVGFWLVDYNASDGFVDGGKRHLEAVLDGLQERGMGAILDLHGLPGSQAANQSFTGRWWPKPLFFDDPHYNARGKAAMLQLARYIKSMEDVPSRAHCVRGIELVNEPLVVHKRPQAPTMIRDLYLEMVPKVREILPAHRYAIYLSFVYPDVLQDSGQWLGKVISQGPSHIWFNVVYDRHLYHAYGDDDSANGPAWTDKMDSCKTCCRDPIFLKGLGSVPFIIGEWSLTTGTLNKQEHNDPAFLREFWAESLSLWKTRALGAFFWSYQLMTQKGTADYFTPFNLKKLIQGPVRLPKPAALDLSRLCPAKDLTRCPSYQAVLGQEPCEWRAVPWST